MKKSFKYKKNEVVHYNDSIGVHLATIFRRKKHTSENTSENRYDILLHERQVFATSIRGNVTDLEEGELVWYVKKDIEDIAVVKKVHYNHIPVDLTINIVRREVSENRLQKSF